MKKCGYSSENYYKNINKANTNKFQNIHNILNILYSKEFPKNKDKLYNEINVVYK